jgi:hypothetical protein
MANDQSAVAFERLDEVADEDRRPAAAPAGDLAELASLLAQVEALLVAGADESPDATAAAVERIADIAFVLQEREVEPSLCDALDAAMRDISEANARNRASVQRAHEAAELLRALARRLDAMMAAQAADVTPAAGRLQGLAHSDELECADEFPAPARLFDGDVAEDTAFAQTVAALAESLPERAEAAPDQVRDSGAAFAALTHADGESLKEETSPSGCTHPAEVMSGVAGLESHENVATASVAVPSPDPAGLTSPVSLAGAVTAPPVDPNRSIDPDEDPGDLFEPISGVRPAPEAPAPAAAAQETAPSASLPPQSPRAAASAPAPAASRPVANDPLAPIRALSEEELIALFS